MPELESAALKSTADPVSTLSLPDFCHPRVVLAVVLIAELVALIFAIARQALHKDFWLDLAGSSMLLLWVGLCCAALLCRTRAWLHTLPTARAAPIAIVLLTATVAIISEIVFQVGQYWGGGLPDRRTTFPDDHAGFLLRNMAVGFIVSSMALRYFYVSTQWKRSIEQEALARVHALQARIRPHFLFNSMNTIAALTRSDPELAEQAVEDLADLFRASLGQPGLRITLADELDIARTHQRIEQLRLGKRLTVHWDIDDLPMHARVPSLILQPLLENAVYHGIEMLPEGGTVSIVGRHDGNLIRMEVHNPVTSTSGRAEREGSRMALENIAQRLELAWPGLAHLETRQNDGRFQATLIFPCEL